MGDKNLQEKCFEKSGRESESINVFHSLDCLALVYCSLFMAKKFYNSSQLANWRNSVLDLIAKFAGNLCQNLLFECFFRFYFITVFLGDI
jgi:hypothetical protein